MRERLRAVDPHERATAASDAIAQLVDDRLWTPIRVAMTYLAMPDEFDTGPLFELAQGKSLAAPRVDWSQGTMEAARISDLSETQSVALGVREPLPTAEHVSPDSLDLVLVPGLAFDPAGRRLGRGKGFYDRFLARLPASVVTVGVGFQFQVVAEVPAEAHDVRVGWLLTECGLTPAASKDAV